MEVHRALVSGYFIPPSSTGYVLPSGNASSGSDLGSPSGSVQLTSTQTGNGTFRSVARLRIPAVTYPLAARSCPVMDFGN